MPGRAGLVGPSLVNIDSAGGVGVAAVCVDARDVVLDSAFHSREAGLDVDHMLVPSCSM